jgi:alpha-galactosidase
MTIAGELRLAAVLLGAITLQLGTAVFTTAAEQWTLATADTSLKIGLDGQGKPAIIELKNPTQQFNWTQQSSPIPLLESVVLNGQNVATNWQFQGATTDTSNGTKLTLRYTSAATGLQMASEWWARPGAGPIHQASSITNGGAGNVTIAYQPTLALQLTTPQADAVGAWHFATDGGYGSMDAQGVYQEQVTQSYSRTLRTDPNAANGAIPLAVLDAGGRQGLYVGTEWSYGDIKIAGSASNPSAATIQSGNVMDFQTTLNAGQVFQVPAGFVGTYNGNIDAAGNSLRKYLFKYNTPEALRNDPTYPKVQWNAFGATAATPGNWNSVERKYYPLVNDAAALGYEEVMLDVGWWHGSEPVGDPQDWSSGMKAAADYAHQHGLKFGLYWTDSADMTTAEGRTTRANRIKKLFQEYGADMWRSDNTSGAVMTSDYWSVKGFYDMIDGLQKELPNFAWENCSSGGRIKDYGAMKRSVKIFNSDNYTELDVRKAFYDTSYAFLPMQIEGHLYGPLDGSFQPQGAAGVKYAFRSVSMGAPEWIIDAPNGGNSARPWTDEEKAAAASVVTTYEAKIRPLVRSADLYHIFARPDGHAWDGMEYYDPTTGNGVVYIFKPDSMEDTHTITLCGLDADRMYYLTFEDSSNPSAMRRGADLMSVGIDVTLLGKNVSELMFIAVPEPGSLAMLLVAGLFCSGLAWRRWTLR